MSQSQDVLQVECLGLEGLKNTTRQFHDLMSCGDRDVNFRSYSHERMPESKFYTHDERKTMYKRKMKDKH